VGTSTLLPLRLLGTMTNTNSSLLYFTLTTQKKGYRQLCEYVEITQQLRASFLLGAGEIAKCDTLMYDYGFLPLHMACWNASADIVHFLADGCGLDVCDTNQDYPLHHACQTANLDVIKYLVEINPLVVSKTNVYNKLPFHMLVENEDDQLVENKDEQVRDRPEFTEACFLLLRAYPETVATQPPSRKRNRE